MTFDKFTLNQYLKGFGVRVAESILLRKGEEAAAEAIVEKVFLASSSQMLEDHLLV